MKAAGISSLPAASSCAFSAASLLVGLKFGHGEEAVFVGIQLVEGLFGGGFLSFVDDAVGEFFRRVSF